MKGEEIWLVGCPEGKPVLVTEADEKAASNPSNPRLSLENEVPSPIAFKIRASIAASTAVIKSDMKSMSDVSRSASWLGQVSWSKKEGEIASGSSRF